MKKLPILSLISLVFIATHSFAQSTDNPLFRNIPPDAATVMQVNLPVFNTRISWTEFMALMPPAKGMAAQSPLTSFIKDPGSAGGDITKDFFIADKEASNDSSGYTAIIVHLSDSAKFRVALKKQNQGIRLFPIPAKNKIRTAGQGDEGMAWDKNLAVIVKWKAPVGKSAKPVAGYALQAAKKALAIIQGYDGSFYTTNPVFKNGFSDNADAHGWIEQGKSFSLLGKGLLKGKSPIDQYLKAGQTGPKPPVLLTLRLDDGKFAIASTTVMTSEQKKLYTKINEHPLAMELQSRIPAGNLLGLLNFRFDPFMLNGILTKLKFRDKVDTLLRARGLPLDTLLSAFNGDVQVVCMEPHSSPNGGKPVFPLYFVTTIRNPSAFFKTALTLKSFTDSAGVDSTGKSKNPFAKLNAKVTVRDNILVIAGSKDMTDGWFTNTEKRNTDFLDERIKKNPFSLYVDFKTVLHFLSSMAKSKGGEPSGKDKKMMEVLSQIDHLEVTGGAVTGDNVEAYFEIKLIDSSPNSVGNFLRSIH